MDRLWTFYYSFHYDVLDSISIGYIPRWSSLSVVIAEVSQGLFFEDTKECALLFYNLHHYDTEILFLIYSFPVILHICFSFYHTWIISNKYIRFSFTLPSPLLSLYEIHFRKWIPASVFIYSFTRHLNHIVSPWIAFALLIHQLLLVAEVFQLATVSGLLYAPRYSMLVLIC